MQYPSTAWIGAFYRERYWSLYDIGGIEHEAESSRKRTAQMLEEIFPADREIKSLLDIGCGTGGMLRSARERWPDAEIRGVDPSEDSVRRCREYGFEVEQVDEMTQVKLRDPRTFDLLTIIHVAEHLSQPVELISSATQYMDQDSLLYLDVPNIMSGRWNTINFIHLAHPQMFHRGSLERLLARCGLEAVEWKYGVAREWPWAIGVLARKRSGGPTPAQAVEPAGDPSVQQVVAHLRRHGNPPLPQGRLQQLRSRVARFRAVVRVAGWFRR